ncbi:MAG TPA: hypothetical protein VE776_07430 [Actinomycetota bacterium]|nr:hypothetical protein [Actinomycetota bacterium]
MIDYIALLIAQDQTRHCALSALPDAPVRQEPAPKARPGRAPLRRAAAGGLRSLADRLEPSTS